MLLFAGVPLVFLLSFVFDSIDRVHILLDVFVSSGLHLPDEADNADGLHDEKSEKDGSRSNKSNGGTAIFFLVIVFVLLN